MKIKKKKKRKKKRKQSLPMDKPFTYLVVTYFLLYTQDLLLAQRVTKVNPNIRSCYGPLGWKHKRHLVDGVFVHSCPLQDIIPIVSCYLPLQLLYPQWMNFTSIYSIHKMNVIEYHPFSFVLYYLFIFTTVHFSCIIITFNFFKKGSLKDGPLEMFLKINYMTPTSKQV